MARINANEKRTNSNDYYESRPNVVPDMSEPNANPEIGRIVFNEADSKMYFYNGNEWLPFGEGGNGNVGANNVSYFFTEDNLDPKSSVNVKQGLDRIITKIDGGQF